MGFVMVVYYTVNTPYEASALKLKSQMDALGVMSHFKAITSLGRWEENTNYKPEFVRNCMAEFADYDIVYTDADSELHAYPALFDSPDLPQFVIRKQDFPWRKNEFMSGTFFVRNNQDTAKALGVWHGKVAAGRRECARGRPHTWEQHHLGAAIVESGLPWMQLPKEYIYYDHIEQIEGKCDNPVITHKQFSRRAW